VLAGMLVYGDETVVVSQICQFVCVPCHIDQAGLMLKVSVILVMTRAVL
jgi:hypothetical protein